MEVTRYFLVFFVILSSALTPAVQSSMINDFANWGYALFGYETCEHPNVHKAGVKRLRSALNKELFGQHLAVDITVTAVKAHLEDPDPQKALVLSFHGWAGSGKTFTSRHLMNSLYKHGVNSSFTNFFLSSYHFPDPNNLVANQNFIRKKVQQTVAKCPRALFIFDEVDNAPAGVLDALVPFIHHPGNTLDGRNYKQAIYVFLSNVGASNITRITQLNWKDGKKREELTFQDFANTLSNEAFNSGNGGLYKSRIIDKILVDHFIPFLPLERRHIISCVKVELKRHGMKESIIDEEAERIADMLTYWPADLKLYSVTGCKKVDSYVKYRIAEMDLANQKNVNGEEDDGEYDNSKTDL